MTKTAGLKTFRKWLLISSLFLAMLYGGRLISKSLQPQNSAEALSCLQSGANSIRENTCDSPIVAAYCLREGQLARPEDMCAFQTLETGQAYDNFLPANMSGTPYWMACHAPYRPEMKPTTRNRAIFEKGCVAPQST